MKLLRPLLVACLALPTLAPTASAAGRLWWSNYGSPYGVSVVALGGSTVTQPWTDSNISPSGVAADMEAGRIYIASFDNDRILSMKPDGTDRRTFVDSTNANPTLAGSTGQLYGLAFDPISKRLYWSDDDTKAVYYASTIDPADAGKFHDGGTDLVDSPVVDTVDRRVYWVNFTGAKIESKTPEGTDLRSVTPSGSCTSNATMHAVAVDAVAGKLYFTGNGQKLSVANLDGTACEDVVTVLGGPTSFAYGLVLDSQARIMYVSDYSGDVIAAVDLVAKTATNLSLTGPAVKYPSYAMITKPPRVGSQNIYADPGVVGTELICGVGWDPGVTGASEYGSPQTTTTAWQLNGATIAGATGTTFMPAKPGSYSCSQTATNFEGSATSTSTAAVVKAMVTVVRPSGGKLKFKSGKGSLKVKAGAAGRVVVSVKAGSRVIATGAVTATNAGTVTVKLKLTARGKAFVKKGGKVVASVTGTPIDGASSKATLKLVCPR